MRVNVILALALASTAYSQGGPVFSESSAPLTTNSPQSSAISQLPPFFHHHHSSSGTAPLITRTKPILTDRPFRHTSTAIATSSAAGPFADEEKRFFGKSSSSADSETPFPTTLETSTTEPWWKGLGHHSTGTAPVPTVTESNGPFEKRFFGKSSTLETSTVTEPWWKHRHHKSTGTAPVPTATESRGPFGGGF